MSPANMDSSFPLIQVDVKGYCLMLFSCLSFDGFSRQILLIFLFGLLIVIVWHTVFAFYHFCIIFVIRIKLDKCFLISVSW